MVKNLHISANEKLKTKLTCKICHEFFRRTIQCPNGHTICKDCFHKMTDPKCPMCRRQYDPTHPKSERIEKLMTLVDAECKFPRCTTTVRLTELAKHEEECEFNIEFLCPFLSFFAENLDDSMPTCRKPVTTHTVQRHLLRKHDLQDIVQSRNTAELTFDHIRLYGECDESQLVTTEDLRYLVTTTTARGDDFDIVISMLDNRSLDRVATINFEKKGHSMTLTKPMRRPVADQVQRVIFTMCDSGITEYIDDGSLKVKITIRSAVP